MKKRILEACFSFLAIFLIAVGFSAALFLGMLLMPLAFIIVSMLAVKEILIWNTNKKPAIEKRMPAQRVSKAPQKDVVSNGNFTKQPDSVYHRYG
ncbi:hypothetical protein [Longitalea luteola]|uniref:hypothetical protein n=1 Tax=Longitalea luteola TaxID=2812563 RepID=UPI001A95D3D0|nr:hypothetical protein [Longitalea luteola]